MTSYLAGASVFALIVLLFVLAPMVAAELRDVMDEIWLPDDDPRRTP